MIKKMLPIILLSGLLVLPLSYCTKSDELSDSEVNEIFNVLCNVFDEALGAANASAAAANKRVAGGRPAVDITYAVNWEGTGKFEGISIKGSISADPDSGYYAGEYTFTIFLYDASPSLKNTVIINSAIGLSHFSGNAYQQIHHSNNDADFEMIIGTKKYNGVYDYDLEAVGTAVTYKGTVVLNGKEYILQYP